MTATPCPFCRLEPTTNHNLAHGWSVTCIPCRLTVGPFVDEFSAMLAWDRPRLLLAAGDGEAALLREIVEGVEGAAGDFALAAQVAETKESREAHEACAARLRAVLKREPSWKCDAMGAGGPDGPQDCSWPHCGCDPHAQRVLDALTEEGIHPCCKHNGVTQARSVTP